MKNSLKPPKFPGQLIGKLNSSKLRQPSSMLPRIPGIPKVPKAKRHKKNWIAGAIKHPGALHRQLGVKAGSKIPAKTLTRAASKGGKLGRRARLAETLKHLRK